MAKKGKSNVIKRDGNILAAAKGEISLRTRVIKAKKGGKYSRKVKHKNKNFDQFSLGRKAVKIYFLNFLGIFS